ncbi:uncharacterized protein LOC122719071 [Apis laboriosa]|uniref:uncharacterized protein LOC122719071 n=1 Tax=Apis laboriosa TaxID=183418 RepID=UPI001CC470E7|nr:uncharacterized protein LOC122719071 [Apis laboriosa]
MSRFQEKYKRWSDPNLYNSCFYCTPISEEEIVPSLYPSELSSQLFSTTQKCVSYKKTSSNYCLCRKHYDEKMKSYDSQNKLKCLKCQESEKIRENLELHLTGTQIEESLAEDKQAALLQHLNLSITALEALAQYGQSLQSSQLAACRVLNISHLLTLPQSYSVNSKSDSLHLTMHLQQV